MSSAGKQIAVATTSPLGGGRRKGDCGGRRQCRRLRHRRGHVFDQYTARGVCAGWQRIRHDLGRRPAARLRSMETWQFPGYRSGGRLRAVGRKRRNCLRRRRNDARRRLERCRTGYACRTVHRISALRQAAVETGHATHDTCGSGPISLSCRLPLLSSATPGS